MDAGGWVKYMGEDTFIYIKEKTGFDLKKWLIKLQKNQIFKIDR